MLLQRRRDGCCGGGYDWWHPQRYLPLEQGPESLDLQEQKMTSAYRKENLIHGYRMTN